MKQGKSKREMDGAMRYCKPVLLGTAAGAAAITVVLMLLSLVLSLQDIPQMLIMPMVFAALAVGSFAGGIFTAKLAREKGLLLGLCCGAALFLLLWICGVQIHEGSFSPFIAVKLVIGLLFGALGGVLGVNVKKRRK